MTATRIRAMTLTLAGVWLCAAPLFAAPPPDDARSQRVFSVHDTDADGYLSRQEYEALLQARRQRQAASGRPFHGVHPPPGFDQIDADQDQLISADELTTILGRRLRLRQRHGQPADE